MFQKLSGKTILIFTLSCLLCLGIGTALGYGAITQDLRATAVVINLDGSDNENRYGKTRIVNGYMFKCRDCQLGYYFRDPVPQQTTCQKCGILLTR